MQKVTRGCLLILLSLPALLNVAIAQSNPLPSAAEKQIVFSKDIEPILSSRCILCHGSAQQMKGLRLHNRQDALRGGESGEVILPGNSADSKLIHLVGAINPDSVMPPAGNRLSNSEVSTLRAWIDQGAEWVLDGGEAAPKQTAAAENSGHWSFRPLRQPLEPNISRPDWTKNAVDSFVLARLEQEGIEPSPELLESYGVKREGKPTQSFAVNCLLARRLVERGVRFVMLNHANWDFHHGLEKRLNEYCHDTDQPTAALLKDLKQRGLLEDTLVLWGGEFGRTPMAEPEIHGDEPGRDHLASCYSMWLAGGGIQGGQVVGKTDDLGLHGVEDKIHVHDLQATILHCLGLDHTKLTYRHMGRDFRLTDVSGKVAQKLLRSA